MIERRSGVARPGAARHADPVSAEDEASYDCPSCGEEIQVPVEPGVGREQEYVEDCPVCCHPCVVHVTLAGDGQVHVSSSPEQDRF